MTTTVNFVVNNYYSLNYTNHFACFILQLHESTVQSRDGNVDKIQLKIFERNLGYRHNDIYLAPELPDIVRLV